VRKDGASAQEASGGSAISARACAQRVCYMLRCAARCAQDARCAAPFFMFLPAATLYRCRFFSFHFVFTLLLLPPLRAMLTLGYAVIVAMPYCSLRLFADRPLRRRFRLKPTAATISSICPPDARCRLCCCFGLSPADIIAIILAWREAAALFALLPTPFFFFSPPGFVVVFRDAARVDTINAGESHMLPMSL